MYFIQSHKGGRKFFIILAPCIGVKSRPIKGRGESGMAEKKIYLADGALLIRRDDGIYFLQQEENGAPLLIEEEEGEHLLFETVEQLTTVIEAICETSSINGNFVAAYEEALREINDYAPLLNENYLLQLYTLKEIARKALEG